MMTLTRTVTDVALGDRPEIFGLRFRPIRYPQDCRALVEVFTACAIADSLDEVMTEADMASFLENPIGGDLDHDYILAEIHGRVVAYGWVGHRLEAGAEGTARSKGDEVHVHRGYVHPAFRRRGIGGAMVRRAWQRAAERNLTSEPAAARLLQTAALESETGAHALAERLGYTAVRLAYRMHRELLLPIPELPLPAGLDVRPARPEHFRAIWEAEREAFQDHWGFAPWPEEAYQRFLDFPHYDPGLWQVAWDGDQVAGMVLNYINADENTAFRRWRGYTEDIAVRRPWRRRGLASALIARSLAVLRARGMTEAALGVDTENRTGALRVYERLGYTPERKWTTYRRPVPQAA